MKRREFIVLVGGAAVALPLSAHTQQSAKVYRIGYLGGGGPVPVIRDFVDGLRELGYVEGQNLAIAFQYAAGKFDQLSKMAAGFVRSKVDVIVAGTGVAAIPAQRATTTIPIVGLSVHDGIGVGLWASLARPGGNVTGIEALAPEIDAKRVEILKGILPQLSRLGVLYNPAVPGSSTHLEYVKQAARVLAITVEVVEVGPSADFRSAFAKLVRQRPAAVLVVTDALIFQERKQFDSFATEHAMPMIYEFKEFIQLGGLASYGPRLSDIWRRGAYYVAKILKGAKPADLPVEQPTTFELVINAKAARALGLTVPPSLLARADEIIE